MAVDFDQLYWFVKERLRILKGFDIPISNARNSNPILVTTEVVHQYSSGQSIEISKVQGNLAANGTFYAKVINSLQLELYGQVNYVTGASNTSPIIVTISNHNFNTADRIFVQEVQGNTAANGTFYVRQQGIAITNITGTSVQTVDNLSNTDTIVVTATGHGLNTGDRVQLVSPSGASSVNGIFYVNVLTSSTYEIYYDSSFVQTVDGTSLGTYEGNSTMQKYSALTVTAISHGLVNKSAIKIIDVTGELAAIGGFYAKVLDANTFELYSDSMVTIPILATAVYTGGGIVALQTNYNLELYADNQLTIPSVGNGIYTKGGLVFSRPVIGSANYIGNGKIVKHIDIVDEFKDTFANVPDNIYESIIKRIKL